MGKKIKGKRKKENPKMVNSEVSKASKFFDLSSPIRESPHEPPNHINPSKPVFTSTNPISPFPDLPISLSTHFHSHFHSISLSEPPPIIGFTNGIRSCFTLFTISPPLHLCRSLLPAPPFGFPPPPHPPSPPSGLRRRRC